MATTYVLIQSTVLSGTQTTITFSSIPSTYTDLVIRYSARTNLGSSTFDQVNIQFNNDTSAIYSYTDVRGIGSGTPSSSNNSGTTSIYQRYAVDATTATANTFGSAEIYIPNYLSTVNKPVSSTTAQENNLSTAYLMMTAGLYRNTSAISTIKLTPDPGGAASFIADSSFYLYGIKNS